MSKCTLLLMAVSLDIIAQGAVPPNPPVPNSGGSCEISTTPAATLLFPYIEVDRFSALGVDTLIAITNTYIDPVIAHATLWNTDGVPLFDFNIYLTGYDVATYSMRDIIVNGVIHANGCSSDAAPIVDGGIDCNGDGNFFNRGPADTDWWQSFPHKDMFLDAMRDNCDGNCDQACIMSIPPDKQNFIRYGMTECSYDNPTMHYTGYLTVDVSYSCFGGTPEQNLYYYPLFDYSEAANYSAENAVTPIAYSNVLMGDYFIIDRNNDYAQGMTAVHIEALGMGPENGGGGIPEIAQGYYGFLRYDFDWTRIPLASFYGKYMTDTVFYGRDRRESLPLRWSFRYIENSAFDGGTNVLVWRSHNFLQGPWSFYDTQYAECHSTMYDILGSQETKLPDLQFVVFDEEEGTVVSPAFSSSRFFDFAGIPSMAGRYDMSIFAPADEAGWIWIDFKSDAVILGLPLDLSPTGAFDQSWLEVVYSASGKYSVGVSGTAIENNCSLGESGYELTIFPHDVQP